MNYYSLIPLFAFLASSFTSAMVMGRDLCRAEHRSFLVYSVALQVWAIIDFLSWSMHTHSNLLMLFRIQSIAWLSVGVLFLRFTYIFIGRKSDRLYTIVIMSTIACAVVAVFSNAVVPGYIHTYWGITLNRGNLFFPVIAVAMLFPFLYALFLLFAAYRRAEAFQHKRQLLLLFTGTLAGVIIGIVTDIICPEFLHYNVVSLSSTGSVLQSMFLFVALTRYRFLSIGIQEVAADLFNNVTDAVVLLSSSGKVIKYNDRAQSMFGFNEDKVSDPAGAIDDYQLCTPYEMLETRVVAAGAEMIVLLTQSPVKQFGYTAGWILILRDITFKKKMELELVEKNKELDTFVYKASHDLKGPLSSIKGIVALARNSDEKDVSPYLDMIDKSISRLDNVLLDLLQVTRVKKSEAKFEQVSFRKIVDDILESLRYHKDYSMIAFNVSCSEPVPFYSDRAALVSLLQNLIVNSINYREQEASSSWVDITVNTGIEGVKIKVADNGVGIAEEHHEKIFDMFFRANASGEGTGLGLYIVKNAVSRLEGTIEVESREGCGTSFSIFLPQPSTLQPSSRPGNKKETSLV
jgi:signal transduction histidine kinase